MKPGLPAAQRLEIAIADSRFADLSIDQGYTVAFPDGRWQRAPCSLSPYSLNTKMLGLRLLPPTARSMRRMQRIIGRSDDMLIIRGVNVFPTQIEQVDRRSA